MMLLVAGLVFTYYTTWAILLVSSPGFRWTSHVANSYSPIFQPFFDASSPIHNYFPAREWAIRLPAFVLVVGLSGIGFFIGSTIRKENRKKAQKAKLRAA
jgi:dolichyl-phosphate mannosyltransferase polypeptide 2 regulatory subunit